MEEDVFLEEKQKLKEIVEKIEKEESDIEKSLSSSDMNYDLENLAKARSNTISNKKVIQYKKYKR